MAILRVGVRVCGLPLSRWGRPAALPVSEEAASGASAARDAYSHQFLVLIHDAATVGDLCRQAERQFERLYGARVRIERLRDGHHFDLDADYVLGHVFATEHAAVVAVCTEDASPITHLVTPTHSPVGEKRTFAAPAAPKAKRPNKRQQKNRAQQQGGDKKAPAPQTASPAAEKTAPVPAAQSTAPQATSGLLASAVLASQAIAAPPSTRRAEASSSEESEDDAPAVPIIRPVPLRPAPVRPAQPQTIASAQASASESDADSSDDDCAESLTGINEELRRSASVLSSVSSASQDISAASIARILPPDQILAGPRPGGAPTLTLNAVSRRKARRMHVPKPAPQEAPAAPVDA